MKTLIRLIATFVVGTAAPAWAGPPYLTDDPVPTDLGHWEIYAFAAGEGRRSTLDADTGFDLNYGAAKGLQMTATIPLSVSHEPREGWRTGSGDVELAAKYRFLNDEGHGFSVALFPRAILPTASHSPDEKMRFLLPLWLEKDFKGGTSLFGGGGYGVNPGKENRDFWQAGIAVTHDLTERISAGAEVIRQGSDTATGTARTRAGVGMTAKLSGHSELLFSGGPTFAGDQTSYHFYGALGLNF